jgi:hypothetical protein
MNYQEIQSVLKQDIIQHKEIICGESGKSVDWEEGFISGLEHVAALFIRFQRKQRKKRQ